jgi:hypothetical protein
MVKLALSFSIVHLSAVVFGATYNIADSIVGSGFNSRFSYQAISDPTHGRV